MALAKERGTRPSAQRSGNKSERSAGHSPDFSPGAALLIRSEKESRRDWRRAFGLAERCSPCLESSPSEDGCLRQKMTGLTAESLARSLAIRSGRASLAARTR